MSNHVTNQSIRNGPMTRDLNAVQRVALALKLRAQKVKYAEIATACGYGSAQAAHKAVMRELERTVSENTEELRREELDSLERLELECWKRLSDKEFTKPMLFAVDRIIAIKERRAKLMNLDVKPEDILANQNYTKRIILTHETSTGGQDAHTNNS